MKTQRDLRKEVDEALSKKLTDAVKAFQAQRDSDFKELVTLKKAVEVVKAERADIQNIMGGLNTRKTSGLAEYNRLTQKLNWMDRQLKGKKGQADTLMTKLTELTVDPKTLTLLLHFKGVKDV